MVRSTTATDEAKFENRVSVRNADVEEGDRVRVVAFDPSNGEEFEVVGDVTSVYADHKFAVQVEGDVPTGVSFIVNDDAKTVRKGSHADGHEVVEGFRPTFVEFHADEPAREGDVDEDDTLVYTQTTHGANEATGKSYTKTEEVRHGGEVYQKEGGITGFRTPEHTGVFFVLPGGTVEYEPRDESRDRYEVGEGGRID